jgi:tRNA-dihydrouridine synthase
MSLLKSIEIDGLKTQNNVFLAPMAGIGDNSYRILGRRFGAGLTFSEMVSAHGITQRNRRTLELLQITPIERPIGIQLFGSDPAIMERAVLTCADYPMDMVDINGGCSVRKVLRTGAGAGLLDDPERFYRVVKACVGVSSRPVSVKLCGDLPRSSGSRGIASDPASSNRVNGLRRLGSLGIYRAR